MPTATMIMEGETMPHTEREDVFSARCSRWRAMPIHQASPHGLTTTCPEGGGR